MFFVAEICHKPTNERSYIQLFIRLTSWTGWNSCIMIKVMKLIIVLNKLLFLLVVAAANISYDFYLDHALATKTN